MEYLNEPKHIGVGRWSSDGAKIAFHQQTGDDTTWNIFIMDIAGKNVRQVTSGEYFNLMPSWSPNGKLLAFFSNRSGNFEIYTIKIDGSNLKQLTGN